VSEKEKETKDSAGTEQPEVPEGGRAASNSLNQDDISKLFGDAGQDEKDASSQNPETEPSQDMEHGAVTPVEGPADAQGLGGEDQTGLEGRSSGVEGSEEIEDEEVQELLAQLEVLEEEPTEANIHGDPEEKAPDRDNMFREADSKEDLSSERGDTDADEEGPGDSEDDNDSGKEEQGVEEPETVTSEDAGEENRGSGDSVEEPVVDGQSDEASMTQDGASKSQKTDGDGKEPRAADNPEKDAEDDDVSATDLDEGLSKARDAVADENQEGEGKQEEEEGAAACEVVTQAEENNDGRNEKAEDTESSEGLSQKDGEAHDDEDEDDNEIDERHVLKRRTKALLLCIGLFSCVIVAAGMAGRVLYKKRYVSESVKEKVPAPVQPLDLLDVETGQGLPQGRASVVNRGPATVMERLEAKLQEAANLRDALLIKAREIDQLKGHFSESIGKTEKEILQERRGHGIASCRQALDNKRIELGLRTIQRREAYVRRLDQPLEWLIMASEELIYVRRKTMIDMEASKIAGGIDLERLITDLGAFTQKNRRGMEGLTIDMATARLDPLETIWKRFTEAEDLQGKSNTERRVHKGEVDAPPFKEGSKDGEIWEELCGGNYARKAELTELSVEAAKCLSKIEVSDLFLNGLTQLSPEAAEHLMKWKGNWICLNGLTQVLPATGKSLFQWPGKVISLNGLSRFPPELAPLLLKWQGTQLELMGLEPSDDISQLTGIKALAQWEASGGRLYVPSDVRRQMEHIVGRSG